MEEIRVGACNYKVWKRLFWRARSQRIGLSTETPHVQENRPEVEDIALLRRAAAGESKAFDSLVDRHAQRLYRLAVSLVGNAADAEDVLQETLVGALRAMGRFDARASVKTWLTRILVTQAALWRRESGRRATLAADAGDQRRAAEGAAGAELRMDLQAALQRLSDEHREVLVLREFEQMSYEEIAQALDVPRGTVESRLHRARSELREKLKAYLS